MTFKSRLVWLLLLATCFSSEAWAARAETIQGKRLTFVFRVSALTNLVYQLDCLAALNGCSKPAYQELWTERLGWNEDDETHLASWRALHEKYRGEVPFNEEASPEVGYPLGWTGVDLEESLRIASFLADDTEEYKKHLSLLMKPADVEAALAVLSHFRDRFDRWWAASGRRQAEPFRKSTVALVRSKNLVGFSERVADLYGADLPKGTNVFFNLVVRPKAKTKGTRGQQIQNQAIIEVLEGERPEHRIDVIEHELFHFFFASAPPSRQAGLLKSFIESDDPAALGGYALLDEAMATALGNGLVARQVSSKQGFDQLLAQANSFYDDEPIDRTAKALMPIVDEYLKTGKGVFAPSFTKDYLGAFRQGLGEAALQPSLVLRNIGLTYDEEFEKEAHEFVRSLRSSSVRSSSPIDNEESVECFKRFPYLSGAIFVSGKQLDHLARWSEVLGKGALERAKAEAKNRKAFVFAVRRSPKAWTFLFIAQERDSMGKLVEAFSTCAAGIEGVCAEPAATRPVDGISGAQAGQTP